MHKSEDGHAELLILINLSEVESFCGEFKMILSGF